MFEANVWPSSSGKWRWASFKRLNQREMNESHLHHTTWLAQMWQAYFSRRKIAWQSSWLYIFDAWLSMSSSPAISSSSSSSQPLLSPWERAPLEPFTPGSVPTAIWLWNIIWNSHAFEGDTAGAISQRSGGVLSARGGGGGGGGGFLARLPVSSQRERLANHRS